MVRFFAATVLFLFQLGYRVYAQQGMTDSSSMWEDVNESSIAPGGSQARTMQAMSSQRTVIPTKYRTISLKKSAMESVLKRAPMEFTMTPEQANVQIDLPLPDGGYGRFLVMESPILPPNLANKYPSIRTYSLQGISDPIATGRIELTSLGFRGLILSDKGRGSIAIDPYWQNNPQGNVSYYLRDSGSKMGNCLTASLSTSQIQAFQKISSSIASLAINNSKGTAWAGGSLRKVRLAIACSGEFAQQVSGVSGSTPGNLLQTLTFITGVANRVSAILTRDFGLSFQLVEAEDQLIALNPSTDLFPDNISANSTEIANINQTLIDNVVGSANYEFGHIFLGGTYSWGVSVGSGEGLVFGILGDASRKAKCVSARGSTDYLRTDFDLLVAHEMGHGLNANHTFSDRYEGTGAQVEPGSGSTIMSYAGITPTGNLQGDSDGYYSSKSLEQMITYASSAPGNAAYETINTGNVLPNLTPLRNYTIPAQTPFVLTASATDDNGDTLTYCWEQLDSAVRAKDPTKTPRDDGSSPLFRSFPPSLHPSRMFPQLNYVLNYNNIPPPGNGTSGSIVYATGEYLPTTTRNMKFRVTVRDNSSGSGGVAYADTTISSQATAGPFAITSFNTADRLVIGSTRTITWSVNNTGAGSTINCANVKISLSLDGGQNFPVVIAASAPNTGSYSFVVPNNATTQGRIKVEAVGNIFFDINNANFVVQVAGASNDAFAEAKILGPAIPATATGTTAGATKEAGEPAHGSGGPFSSLWFRLDADRTGIVTLSTAGSAFDTVLALYKGSELGKLTKVAANNDAGVGITTSLLQFSMEAGTTYYIVLDGNRGATGSYVLTATGSPLSQAPANDMADFPANLGNGFSFTQKGSILGATAQSGEPALAGLPATRSVWFRYTAPATGRLVVDTDTSDKNFNSVLGVYSGTVGIFSSLKLLAANDDISSTNLKSSVSLPVTSGTTYIIKVDGRKSSTGSYTLRGAFSTPLPSCPAPATASFTMTKIAGTTTYRPSVTWSPVTGPVGYPVTAYEVQLIYAGQAVVNSGSLSAATLSYTSTALSKLGYTARVRAIAGPITGAWREVPAKVSP